MQIDPDRDLLIFKIREERTNSTTTNKSISNISHRINFNLIDEDLKNIEKPIISELTSVLHKMTEHKKKVKNVETTQPQTIVKPVSTEATLPIEQPSTQQEVQPIDVEKAKQLQDIQDQVNDVLKKMRNINKLQKIISNDLE